MSDGHSVPADCYADPIVHYGPREPVTISIIVQHYCYAEHPGEVWCKAVGLEHAEACGATPAEAKRRLVAWLESRAHEWAPASPEEYRAPVDCADVGDE